MFFGAKILGNIKTKILLHLCFNIILWLLIISLWSIPIITSSFYSKIFHTIEPASWQGFCDNLPEKTFYLFNE